MASHDWTPTTSSKVAAASTAHRMAITVSRHRSGTTRVRVVGEVDLGTAPHLGHVLRRACANGYPDPGDGPAPPDDSSADARSVLCDLTGVEFLSAAGVGALAAGALTATTHGLTFSLVADTRRVRRVLALTGLDRQLLVTTRQHEALDASPPQPRRSHEPGHGPAQRDQPRGEAAGRAASSGPSPHPVDIPHQRGTRTSWGGRGGRYDEAG